MRGIFIIFKIRMENATMLLYLFLSSLMKYLLNCFAGHVGKLNIFSIATTELETYLLCLC